MINRVVELIKAGASVTFSKENIPLLPEDKGKIVVSVRHGDTIVGVIDTDEKGISDLICKLNRDYVRNLTERLG
jgi:putative methionine-R-sulfoxide reductase with GAF domain